MSDIKIHCNYSKLVNIKELKPHPKNRNKHPTDQIDRLCEIIKFQGIRQPIKVSNRSGFITAGHGRLEAFKKLGLKEVPVSYQDYDSDEQELADLTSDNAIGLWSQLDFEGIKADFKDLDFDINLLGINGFSLVEIDLSKEWIDMPEYNQEDKNSFRHIVVHFESEVHVNQFFKLIKQDFTDKTKTVWIPKQKNMDSKKKSYE